MPFKNLKLLSVDYPFKSTNFQFSKELSKYSSQTLGRAFFSDGNVRYNELPFIYDNIQLFSNSNLASTNKPLYYKIYEIKVVVYTLENIEDLQDKYHRVDLAFDEMCVFFLKLGNHVKAKIKLGESLLKHSRFENFSDMANFAVHNSTDEMKRLTLSTQEIIDFLSLEKPLFADLVKDYKNIELQEIFFLNDNEEILKPLDDEILGIKKSDILYGEKIKIRVTGNQIIAGSKIKIKLIGRSENENQKFDGIDAFEWEAKFNKNIAETPYFFIRLKWFDETIEVYNYSDKESKQAYKTTFLPSKINHFFVEVSFDKTQIVVSGEENVLIPISYTRNYEELLGLFKKDDKSGKKSSSDNYETYFISKNSEIEKITKDFIKYINEFPAEVYKNKSHLQNGFNPEQKRDLELKAIKERVEKDAAALWINAYEPFKEKAKNKSYDDRPLYWARLKMQSQLKRLPIFKQDIDFVNSQVIENSKQKELHLCDLITLFEEKSRNYTGINFGNSNSKKVLITGFDPFILNEIDNEYLKEVSRPNILQSNPSGCCALWLAANHLENSVIQTLIVPVRYADFDGSNKPEEGIGEGIIEKYIKPWIKKVDMIITISQYVPKENVIDMFGTLRRGGFNENQNYTRKVGSKAIETKTEWIQTTLKDIFTYGEHIKLNWQFNGEAHIPETYPREDEVLNEGSGGDYLSNEIFYRVAKLRKEIKPNLPTGHFHIAKLQSTDKREQINYGIKLDYDMNLTSDLINKVKNAINEASKKI